MKIDLNLLEYQPLLKIKKEGDKHYLFCPIRKKHLVLQPEELVRQLLIIFFIEKNECSKTRIAVEKSLIINELSRRFDILIYDENTKPFMLIECKAPEVKINQSTFEQISQYNLSLRVPYLLVTNGMSTYCCKMDYQEESFEFIPEIPQF